MSLRFAGIAIVGAILSAPASATIVVNYSLYTLGNYTEQGGSQIAGGVAVAGDAKINSVSIGGKLGADRDKTGVVLVGGNVQYENSSLAHGNVVYGVGNSSGKYTQASTPGGSFVQGSDVDFKSTSAALLGLSAGYGALDVTGKFTNLWGAGALTGSEKPGTDVFSLSTDTLGGIYSLKLVGAVGSKAIINITGEKFGSYFNFDRGNYAVSDITFNFVNAKYVGLNGIDLAGSILAPLATISQQGGKIAGNVVASNYTSGGANIGGDGAWTTSGDSVGAIPEPASWAMMIAGFGLVGATMRRRRSRLVAA